MSQETQPQTQFKSQLKMKLIRRIFNFILVVFIYPAMLMLLILSTDGAVEESKYFDFALMGSVIIFLILIAMALLRIAPVVIELLDVRKMEREEDEDVGMFP